MVSPLASGYDLGKQTIERSQVEIFADFDPLPPEALNLLLRPRIDGNGMLSIRD